MSIGPLDLLLKVLTGRKVGVVKLGKIPQPDPEPVSSLLTLVSGGFVFNGSGSVNAARTLAVSPANPTSRIRPRCGKSF